VIGPYTHCIVMVTSGVPAMGIEAGRERVVLARGVEIGEGEVGDKGKAEVDA
jgi:hypothetical protein